MSAKRKKDRKPLDVSIIISNFNGEILLKKNLPSVLKAKANKKNRIREIIVVDDSSMDGSTKLIKNEFQDVSLIKHRINRGFSAVVNTGARASKGKLICLINNDVSPKENFLEHVFVHLNKEGVFAISLHEAGYGWAKGKFEDGFVGFEPGRESKNSHNTFWVNGGSGVFKRDLWMKLGGMDEKLFSPFYWEDLDLSYRAAKRGYELLWEPNAKVYHKHETTMKLFPKKFVERTRERNQLLFIWKNLTSPNLFRRHISGLFRRLARHPGYLRIVFMALTKFRAVSDARKKEKRESKVSDEAIFARFT